MRFILFIQMCKIIGSTGPSGINFSFWKTKARINGDTSAEEMGGFAIYNLYSYLTKHTILIFSLNVMCILEQMFVECSLRIHQFIFTVVMLGKFPKCG